MANNTEILAKAISKIYDDFLLGSETKDEIDQESLNAWKQLKPNKGVLTVIWTKYHKTRDDYESNQPLDPEVQHVLAEWLRWIQRVATKSLIPEGWAECATQKLASLQGNRSQPQSQLVYEPAGDRAGDLAQRSRQKTVVDFPTFSGKPGKFQTFWTEFELMLNLAGSSKSSWVSMLLSHVPDDTRKWTTNFISNHRRLHGSYPNIDDVVKMLNNKYDQDMDAVCIKDLAALISTNEGISWSQYITIFNTSL